jgi:hypothetical protein
LNAHRPLKVGETQPLRRHLSAAQFQRLAKALFNEIEAKFVS